MPAPISSRRCAWSNTVTPNPCRAIAKAAVSPPIPAPAMMTVREDATAHVSVASIAAATRLLHPPARRAIGTDDLACIAHVEEHVRVIERSQLALAHELPRADLDDRDARRVVEVRNDPLRHVLRPPSTRPSLRLPRPRGTIASRVGHG